MINEMKLMKEVCNHYSYEIDKTLFKEQYRENTLISNDESKLTSAIEFIMLRLSETQSQVNEIEKLIIKTKNNRTRQINLEIKKIEDFKIFLQKYGNESKIKKLLEGIDYCIEDLEQLKKRTTKKYITQTTKGNNNIRYGYGNNLKILNPNVKELTNTTTSHITECINLHLEYLYTDLEDQQINYNKENIKNLFGYYFENLKSH